jgi:hypothetical protein
MQVRWRHPGGLTGALRYELAKTLLNPMIYKRVLKVGECQGAETSRTT